MTSLSDRVIKLSDPEFRPDNLKKDNGNSNS